MTTVELVCLAPGPISNFTNKPGRIAIAKAHEVEVQVYATTVNPIDVKRSGGYGRRLLSLAGAGSGDLVLGNDFAGRVLSVGSGVTHVHVGDLVFGVVPTGRAGGAHRSHLTVQANLVRRIPRTTRIEAAAVLPYTFCTLWQAIKGVGLDDKTAQGQNVLVNGGGGLLGQLAIQLLTYWGSNVTAVCGARSIDLCLSLGAVDVLDRRLPLSGLTPTFDVTLNFGDWADDEALVELLGPAALGHSTTVHPLMTEFDTAGWLAGAMRCWRTVSRLKKRVKARAAKAKYVWALFRPDPVALDALAELLEVNRLRVKTGPTFSFADGQNAFDYVKAGSSARPILSPEAWLVARECTTH